MKKMFIGICIVALLAAGVLLSGCGTNLTVCENNPILIDFVINDVVIFNQDNITNVEKAADIHTGNWQVIITVNRAGRNALREITVYSHNKYLFIRVAANEQQQIIAGVLIAEQITNGILVFGVSCELSASRLLGQILAAFVCQC